MNLFNILKKFKLKSLIIGSNRKLFIEDLSSNLLTSGKAKGALIRKQFQILWMH